MSTEFDVARWLSEAEGHLPGPVMKQVKSAVSGYVASEVARMQRLLATLGGTAAEFAAAATSRPRKRETAQNKDVHDMTVPEVVFHVLADHPQGLDASVVLQEVLKLRSDIEEANVRSALYRESTKETGRLTRRGSRGSMVYFLKEGATKAA